MNIRSFLSAAALAALMSGTAFAQAGQWTGRILGGADFAIGGNVHGAAVAPVPNLGALNPDLEGVAATLDIGARSQSNIYGEAWGLGVELGYGLSDRSELFGSLRYSSTGSGSTPVGVAVVPALSASLPVNGRFGSQDNWAVELGYRQYLTDGPARFYLAGRAGAAFSNRVNATFTIPDAGIALNNVPFHRPSTLFTGGLDAGISYDIGNGIALIGETGIRYTSGPRGDDAALSGLGLASINNAGERWDIPVRIGLGFKF